MNHEIITQENGRKIVELPELEDFYTGGAAQIDASIAQIVNYLGILGETIGVSCSGLKKDHPNEIYGCLYRAYLGFYTQPSQQVSKALFDGGFILTLDSVFFTAKAGESGVSRLGFAITEENLEIMWQTLEAMLGLLVYANMPSEFKSAQK